MSVQKLFLFFLFFLSVQAFYSCAEQPAVPPPSKTAVQKKPGSSFTDTVVVAIPAVVFYGPDDLQNQRIKAITEHRIFEGLEHDFFYQQKFGHNYIKDNWPRLKTIDVRDARFICFKKGNGRKTYVDLDKLDDAYGMLVFDGTQEPQLIDMSNMASQVPDYFRKQQQSAKKSK